jgi:sugar phosphate isomerase/epimerase
MVRPELPSSSLARFHSLSRRGFLATGVMAAIQGAVSGTRIRLGGPTFLQTGDMKLLAREHRRLGYSAAYCPSTLRAGQTATIQEAKKAFQSQDVVIAEVGAWKNLLASNSQERSANLAFVAERLALADEIGAKCCVDIGGSFNQKLWDGPDPRNLTEEFFDATVLNCRKLIDEVKPRYTAFSVEMMGWSLPNTPDCYLRLIKAVDRKAFGVHVDICNIVDSPERYYSNGRIIEDVFNKLGRWILSCHAKDVGPRATHLTEVIPGRGGIDYRRYLTCLANLPIETPLMLEHLQTADEYDEGRRYILSIGKACGVSFA